MPGSWQVLGLSAGAQCDACAGVPGSFHRSFASSIGFCGCVKRGRHVSQGSLSGSVGDTGSGCLRVTSRDGLIPDEENIRLRDRAPVSFQTTPVLLCQCPWFVKRPLDESHSYFMSKERALSTALTEK